MGPGIINDVHGSSATRDAEVTRLRKELELSSMRLSQMQTRLMATLDELDALRFTHQSEIKNEKRAKEKLSEKLDRYLDEVKRAEAERDEMREVVSILVDKVEKSSDYSAWPYSRMSLARPLEPLRTPARSGTESDDDAINIALLQATISQLEDERRAHARTREESDAEILRLRAMIARRDAELEACATHSGHSVLLSSSFSGVPLPSSSRTRSTSVHGCRRAEPAVPGPSRLHSVHAPETRDGQILSQTLTRQRTLEREVEFLQEQLQHARTAQSRTESLEMPAGGIVPSAAEPPAVPILTAMSSKPVPPGKTSRREPPRPPTPRLHPRATASSPSHYDLSPTADPNHHNPYRNPGTQREASDLTPSVAAEIRNLDTNLALDDLKRQLTLLSAEIVAFSVQRDALKKMLEDTQGAPSAPNAPESEPVFVSPLAPTQSSGELALAARVLHHEGECAREVRALRRQLEDVTRERAQREQALQTEIDILRQALFNPTRAAGGSEGRYASGDLNAPSFRASTPFLSAPRVAVPDIASPNVMNAPTVRAEEGYEDGDERPSEGQKSSARHAVSKPYEDGSELYEQSMELATPLHPTILSLADDDFLIPSLPPTIHGIDDDIGFEPREMPLPIPPDHIGADAPLITFSPPPLASHPA